VVPLLRRQAQRPSGAGGVIGESHGKAGGSLRRSQYTRQPARGGSTRQAAACEQRERGRTPEAHAHMYPAAHSGPASRRAAHLGRHKRGGARGLPRGHAPGLLRLLGRLGRALAVRLAQEVFAALQLQVHLRARARPRALSPGNGGTLRGRAGADCRRCPRHMRSTQRPRPCQLRAQPHSSLLECRHRRLRARRHRRLRARGGRAPCWAAAAAGRACTPSS